MVSSSSPSTVYHLVLYQFICVSEYNLEKPSKYLPQIFHERIVMYLPKTYAQSRIPGKRPRSKMISVWDTVLSRSVSAPKPVGKKKQIFLFAGLKKKKRKKSFKVGVNGVISQSLGSSVLPLILHLLRGRTLLSTTTFSPSFHPHHNLLTETTCLAQAQNGWNGCREIFPPAESSPSGVDF